MQTYGPTLIYSSTPIDHVNITSSQSSIFNSHSVSLDTPYPFLQAWPARARPNMPTPADNDRVSVFPLTTHSCPPEDDARTSWTHSDVNDTSDEVTTSLQRPAQQPTPPPQEALLDAPTDPYISRRHKHKRVVTDEDNTVVDMLSPVSVEGEKQDEYELPARNGAGLGSPADIYDFSNVRVGRTRRLSTA
jgi:hypothetical protein